ncbi:sigma-54-dependent transcriptional regulator [Geopsychrobacter electrodiphilus]|uniref:sigma-54-dependent transcriptional regulator n=1 Tax=Geopsychrobacter electrodiphilus TaxID=225196 RepID=UPI0003793DCC|nr:sigma-54 dependent transcriptional regulator [Geopsychrobacter electrodiphilus]
MAKQEKRVLVVDDEASMREMLAIMLTRDGFAVSSASDGAQGLEMFRQGDIDLVISDIRMPHMGGIDLLREIKALEPDALVIMMTAFSTTEEAVEAMKLGAYDYFIKPFKTDEVRLVIGKALENSKLKRENVALRTALGERYSFSNLIGKSPVMQRLYSMVERVADSQANVLVCGESGTGKELVARAVHFNSPRKSGPFVPVNCGAIPETLIESELFGHEKGSFTGADRKKEGLFESANGGTLFLDEIGELPLSMQVKLLRVLQEREFRRVGGTQSHPLDIRLVAATNKNLEAQVSCGKFREDLYYRLNVVSLNLPPLRERLEDVPLLLDYFYAERTGEKHLPVRGDTLRLLLEYDWPGNIRELQNLVERCVVLGWDEEITADCLPAQLLAAVGTRPAQALAKIPESGFDLEAHMAEIERMLLLQALEQRQGVKKRAAELLGISFRSIRYRLAKLGLGGDDDEG